MLMMKLLSAWKCHSTFSVSYCRMSKTEDPFVIILLPFVCLESLNLPSFLSLYVTIKFCELGMIIPLIAKRVLRWPISPMRSQVAWVFPVIVS